MFSMLFSIVDDLGLRNMLISLMDELFEDFSIELIIKAHIFYVLILNLSIIVVDFVLLKTHNIIIVFLGKAIYPVNFSF